MSTAEALPLREKDLQKLIVDWLRLQGYEVLEVGAFRQRTRCGACGHEGYLRGATSSVGVPDLLVWHAELGLHVGALSVSPVWVGLEVKTKTGRPSARQRELADLGATRIVRSLEDVERVLLELGLPVRYGVG